MRDAPSEVHSHHTLFVADTEIARRLGVGFARWKALRPVLEKRGLPKADPLIGRRYWPAVRAYFDRRAGLDSLKASAVDDGEVNYDALR
jgi:hypothetical protein